MTLQKYGTIINSQERGIFIMNLRTVLRSVLIAVFMPFAAFAEDFQIIYHLNNGTNYAGAPTTYTAGVGATIDGTPTRAHSTFAGWCTDAELTQNCGATQTIGTDATGNKEFYAKWGCQTGWHGADDGQSCVGNQYNVTYNCGDADSGSVAPASTTATYGSTFSPVMIMKNLCEKNGNILSGWAVNGDMNNIKTGSFTWNYTSDKTLTAQWEEFDPKFTITTTNMPANTTFKYWQGSEGLFYVDWGDDTLQTIGYRGTISHTYTTGGVRTIRFGGLATQYFDVNFQCSQGSVSFGSKASNQGENVTCSSNFKGTPTLIAGISGSLGQIYPSPTTNMTADELYNNGNGIYACGPKNSKSVNNPNACATVVNRYNNQPKFIGTFYGCTNLTGQIPSELFNGVTGSSGMNNVVSGYNCSTTDCYCTTSECFNRKMFASTFDGCTNLGRDGVNGTPTYGIPAGLFAGLQNVASAGMIFEYTFRGCSGLIGEIPGNLFNGVSGIPRARLFNGTFYGCENLGKAWDENNNLVPTYGIPQDLFLGINGDAGIDSTFSGGTGAYSAFYTTFAGCSGLTGPIPENLFGRVENGVFKGVTGAAQSLFYATFARCRKLSGSIPENLFGRVLKDENNNDVYYGVTGAAESMFDRTFMGACSIESTIPSNLFTKSINGINNGVSGTANKMFLRTFDMNACGANGLPESGITGFVKPALFAGVKPFNQTSTTDIFTDTFRNTRMDTVCPCGHSSDTTAWGISTVDGRAVCNNELKPNEHYYTGNNGTVCTTNCDFATNLKTSNGLSYPLFSSQVTVPTMVLKSGDTQCYVPLESGNGGQDSLNLFWGGDTYHAGHEDPED